MTDTTQEAIVKPAKIERPLSPHIGIYRWQISMVLSIMHRATGIALSAFAIFLVLVLYWAAYSPECYAKIAEYSKTPLGNVVLIAAIYAFFYHFANGLRHLGWDAGKGFAVDVMTRTGWIVVVGAAFATFILWFVL